MLRSKRLTNPLTKLVLSKRSQNCYISKKIYQMISLRDSVIAICMEDSKLKTSGPNFIRWTSRCTTQNWWRENSNNVLIFGVHNSRAETLWCTLSFCMDAYQKFVTVNSNISRARTNPLYFRTKRIGNFKMDFGFGFVCNELWKSESGF